MNRRYRPLLIIAAATAALTLAWDEQVRPTSRAIEHQPIVQPEDTAPGDATTPGPVVPVVPMAAEATIRANAPNVERFRISGPTETRRSLDISEPVPVEETGRETRPAIVEIGVPLDADGLIAGNAYRPEPELIQIGRTMDANETDVWYLPGTSAGTIEIGTPLDADSRWPDEGQEREPVDIGPPIETEGLGTLR